MRRPHFCHAMLMPDTCDGTKCQTSVQRASNKWDGERFLFCFFLFYITASARFMWHLGERSLMGVRGVDICGRVSGSPPWEDPPGYILSLSGGQILLLPLCLKELKTLGPRILFWRVGIGPRRIMRRFYFGFHGLFGQRDGFMGGRWCFLTCLLWLDLERLVHSAELKGL